MVFPAPIAETCVVTLAVFGAADTLAGLYLARVNGPLLLPPFAHRRG